MKFYPSILIFLIALLYGCKKEIVFDLNEGDNEKLAVEGYITTETKAHQIILTRSTDYYFNEAPVAVSGATVTISDGANSFPLVEQPGNTGIYETVGSFAGVEGITYTLSINDGSKDYSATSIMPFAVPIDSVDAIPDTSNNPFLHHNKNKDYYSVRMAFADPPGIGNYYLWILYKNGVLITDTLNEVLFGEDRLVDGSYFPLDEYFNYPAEVGDTMTLVMLSIPEEVFEFFIGVSLETEWKGGIFDAPPANVNTNITGGGMGLFYAAAISSRSVIIN
ncbi:MAG: DUF4249 domain-containing protein [Bacteroidetes bacterium]|nr:DUF4249 domain-containing protein [Bacteroidota bacterium]